MQGHLKINIDLFSALCPPQLHKNNFSPAFPFVERGGGCFCVTLRIKTFVNMFD
jgi:hypothetical protein